MPVTILDAGAVRPIHKGAWSSTATYETSNIVFYDGSSWMMSAPSYTVGTTPTEGATWKMLAQKGAAYMDSATTTTAGITMLASDAEITAGTNTTKIVTPKNLSDKVSAEIADLVNSAPEALDTLNELAAALGDDPNFATTVATNIGTVSTAASVAQTTANSAVSAAATAQSAADAVATTTTTGRVSVGTGLEVTAAGALSISSENQTTLSGAASLLTEVSVEAGALKVVRADSSGKISSGYLPISTTTSVGGVAASASFSVDQTTGEATVPAATEALAGIARKATDAEVEAGIEDGSVFITPHHLKNNTDSGNNVHFVGEWVQLRNSSPPSGYYVRNGALIENASTTVPKLWAYLQEDVNTEQCITQTEWTAMQAATYTLATGTEVAYWEDGVGGVPYYVLDAEADTLRLPDTRGMYAEDAGFDGLAVGDAHGDMIRNIEGSIYQPNTDNVAIQFLPDAGYTATGAIQAVSAAQMGVSADAGILAFTITGIKIDASQVVPTGNANKPRAYGMLGCIYAG